MSTVEAGTGDGNEDAESSLLSRAFLVVCKKEEVEDTGVEGKEPPFH